MAPTARIITAAPAGATRRRLEEFLQSKGAAVCSLQRETAVSQGRLMLDHDQILWDGDDVLQDANAALVLDSGYMWPVPLLEPTAQQWEQFYGCFDDYLRNDRESASLWLSLMALLNDRVPRCFNRQPAFAAEAMKHDTLEALRESGVPVAPALTTNDPEAVSRFAGAHQGPLLELPLVPGPARWIQRRELPALPLQQRPVMLLALERAELVRVIVVGNETVVQSPADLLPAAALEALPAAMQPLEAGWAELWWGQGLEGWCLCDFSVAPDLGGMDEARAGRVLEALWRHLQTPGENPQPGSP